MVPSATSLREVTPSGASGIESVPRPTTEAGALLPDPAAASPQPRAPASAEALPQVAGTQPPSKDAPEPAVARDAEAAFLPEITRKATGSAGAADASYDAAADPMAAAPDGQGRAGQRPRARSAFAAAMAGGSKSKSEQVREGASYWRPLARDDARQRSKHLSWLHTFCASTRTSGVGIVGRFPPSCLHGPRCTHARQSRPAHKRSGMRSATAPCPAAELSDTCRAVAQGADGEAQAAAKRMRASFQLPFAAAPSAQAGEASQPAADDDGSAAAVLDDRGAAAGGTTGADIRAFIDAQSPAAVAGGEGGRAPDAPPQQSNGGTFCRGHFSLQLLGASASDQESADGRKIARHTSP